MPAMLQPRVGFGLVTGDDLPSAVSRELRGPARPLDALGRGISRRWVTVRSLDGTLVARAIKDASRIDPEG